jgi:hypothetical protein
MVQFTSYAFAALYLVGQVVFAADTYGLTYSCPHKGGLGRGNSQNTKAAGRIS